LINFSPIAALFREKRDILMKLSTEAYLMQSARWPQRGQHILAHYDENSIVVYQAYRPAIGQFAVAHGYFGGSSFSFNRMSWIKPNFLWMMYRSGWGTKEGQEVVLAVWLKRSSFEIILRQAVHSTFIPEIYGSEAAWKEALRSSPVRLQWDPDHDPTGAKLARRAIQLGLSGEVLAHYARDWILNIEDISPFVREQHFYVRSGNYSQLITPQERVYVIEDVDLAKRLAVSRL
jgi:hypothetical protein